MYTLISFLFICGYLLNEKKKKKFQFKKSDLYFIY